MNLKLIIGVCFSILIIGCKNNDSKTSDNAVLDKPVSSTVLYMGGDIITMDGNALEMVEAVVTGSNYAS